MSKVTCPYCGSSAVLIMGIDLYPEHPETFARYYWKCPGVCDAHVGANLKSLEPNGPLANRTLRNLRVRCHLVFDQLWKDGHFNRREAYEWLAKSMEMTREDCHIAKFNEDDCKVAQFACARKLFLLETSDE